MLESIKSKLQFWYKLNSSLVTDGVSLFGRDLVGGTFSLPGLVDRLGFLGGRRQLLEGLRGCLEVEAIVKACDCERGIWKSSSSS